MSDTHTARPRKIDDIRAIVRKLRMSLTDMRVWKARDYYAPSPKAVKDCVLRRNGINGATWVETGTFLGETTAMLAQSSGHVYSFEPAAVYFARAQAKFARNAHVTIIKAASEVGFPELLPTLKGPVNFWLDGHYSAGATFQGELDTPIVAELEAIEQNLKTLAPLCVLVDDIRCFNPANPDYATYPALDFLVDWARRNDLVWHIEHDIFIAQSR